VEGAGPYERSRFDDSAGRTRPDDAPSNELNLMRRLAIVGTPRSGNTWLRYILAKLYQLDQFAVHTPDALDWRALPENCVVQLHWHNTVEFRSLLRKNGFRVAVIARHPLDVLISILHFAPHEPETACWLMGEAGSEESIYHKLPVDPAFVSYAVSARAKTLLSLSPEWWGYPDALCVKYEDLVLAPLETLNAIGWSDFGSCAVSPSDAIDGLTLEKLKPTARNQHFWQGQPGLWRSLLPINEAREIEAAHQNVFSRFGYSCEPDPGLTIEQVKSLWSRLA